MKQYKLLFLGPVASGKTTAIRSLCGDSFVSTEAKPTDDVLQIKNETTVAMDYGVFNFGSNKKLHVYGAPGQARFKFMMDILLEGCLGVALLINVTYSSVEDIPDIINLYRDFLDRLPCSVGLTHTESLPESEINRYIDTFLQNYKGINDVLIIDPRKQKDVAQLVENIVLKIR